MKKLMFLKEKTSVMILIGLCALYMKQIETNMHQKYAKSAVI